MAGTYFLPGAHNSICDRRGWKLKSTQVRREWTGSTVDIRSWEERHPQDLIRSVQDRQDVDDPNPEATDNFLTDNEVTADSL